MDFGLAKTRWQVGFRFQPVVRPRQHPAQSSLDCARDGRWNLSVHVAGTGRGQAGIPMSDIFALGALLYE